MLIVVSSRCVINLSKIDCLYIESASRGRALLNFGKQPVEFKTMERAKEILAEIVAAYESGAKVYRLG